MTGVDFTCNDWRRGGVQWLLCNCIMHEWHQSLHRFSYLVLFISSYVMCILLCSIFNEDNVSFMYLCNDRELMIMNSRLLCDE